MRPSPPSGLEFRILGGLQVWRGACRIEVGGPRHRALLGVLVLHRRRVVSTDRLIDLVWGDHPPANATNTVHVVVSQLRRALAADGETSPLTTRRPGYLLEVAPGHVDVEVAERLRDEGAAAMAAGNAHVAARALSHAAALWRGEPVPELADCVELAGERRRLADLRLDILEERIDADLACGRHRHVLADATALLRAEPLRERLRAQLMVALYRCGRQADALEVYRDGRAVLVADLGLEPGPELRELERAILNHDPALQAPSGAPARRSHRWWLAVGAGVAAAALAAAVAVHGRGAQSQAAALVGLVRGSGGLVVKAQIPAAGPIAVQPDGTAWVANTGAGTITRVARSGGVRVFGVGGRPSDLAWGYGELWIGAATDRRLLAFNPRTGSVTLSVRLASNLGPIGQPDARLAIGAHSVWVDNGGSAGVWRINPVTGRVEARVGNVQTGAIAYGLGAVWVAGGLFDSPRIDRINPRTNRRTLSIGLPAGTPAAITVVGGALWVAEDDGSLWRVDPTTGATTRVPTRTAVTALVSNTGAGLWIAAANGVSRLEPTAGRVVDQTRISGRPVGLAAAAAGVWVTAARPASTSPAPTGRGTITVALNSGIDSIDPARAFWAAVWQIEYATGLRLLTYPDVPGPAGTRLVPDAAASMPAISNHGRTYTFTVRPGLRFWPGRQPVTAASFQAAVERALSPGVGSSYAQDFMGDVVGAVAYERGHATHIRGIRVSHRMTISFTTTTVDPDFPSRIAMPFYAAVPPDTKDTPALRPLPTAGPFYIRTYRPGSVLVLRRNPGYTGPRRGRARSIVYRLGGAQTTPAWRLVATGEADYDADPVAPSQLADARRAGAGHIGLAVQPAPTVAYLALNRRSPRMRDVKLRRAIALAINRRALARTFGPDGATPTDQYLPPVSPAYPGNGLAYSLERADVTAARRLISGTGLHPPITLRLSTCGSTCPGDGAAARARLLRAELARIGIRLVSHVLPREHQFILDTSRTNGYDIADEGFVFPNPDPDLITFPVTAEANMPLSRRIRMADHLPVPRRYGAWRRIDLALARRRAPLAAFAILNTLTLTNRRLGCLVVQPMYGLDLTRACVRSFAR